VTSAVTSVVHAGAVTSVVHTSTMARTVTGAVAGIIARGFGGFFTGKAGHACFHFAGYLRERGLDTSAHILCQTLNGCDGLFCGLHERRWPLDNARPHRCGLWSIAIADNDPGGVRLIPDTRPHGHGPWRALKLLPR